MTLHYLVVRTEIRRLTPHDLDVTWAARGHARDERACPEPRRQTAFADSLDAALMLARALASVGPVRAGRQRVKVIRLDRYLRSAPAPGPWSRSPAPLPAGPPPTAGRHRVGRPSPGPSTPPAG
jgi:hypothetical protein